MAAASDTWREAAATLCHWVDARLERFRPAVSAGPNLLRDVTPFTELSMIVYALAPTRFRIWPATTAERLWPMLEELGARRPPETIGRHPRSAELLLAFPLLEDVTGRRSLCHDEVARVMGEPASMLDGELARDIAGATDCREAAERELARLLDTWDGGPTTTSWTYAVTHALFYATKLGRRRLASPTAYGPALGTLARRAAEARRWDLAAELLVALAWARLDGGRDADAGRDALAAVALEEGSVLSDPRVPTTHANEFESRYHATVVALAALAGDQR